MYITQYLVLYDGDGDGDDGSYTDPFYIFEQITFESISGGNVYLRKRSGLSCDDTRNKCRLSPVQRLEPGSRKPSAL